MPDGRHEQLRHNPGRESEIVPPFFGFMSVSASPMDWKNLRAYSDTMPHPYKLVPTVVKTCAILRLLDAHLSDGLSLTSICTRLAITKSHCLQILRTLEAEGWIRYEADRRRYYLAAALLADLAAIYSTSDATDSSRSLIQQLAEKLALPCVLTRINADGSFTSILSAQPDEELQFIGPSGRCYPADIPAQMRARLAALKPARAERILDGITLTAYTPSTLTDRTAVLKEIDKARRAGYAVGRMEYQEGIVSIATAITDMAGEPRQILQCVGLPETMLRREREIGQALIDTSRLLQRLRTD